ncbi:radical SAM protein [Kosmotoga pacifica]|uniref:Radical SAM protein n=1 Tax=Kosmotoga pacifica TaxID=1330330 RepID=A0A0G2Z5A3_9BACT|nr:4Fe-4S cluster-binding domain-containing protein [Kosmotoga pacifica]AKI96800.1 radical SAM protein [Kosmotoga pacifica]
MTYPTYLAALENGQIDELIMKLDHQVENCQLCPRKCMVNRKRKVGVCGQRNNARIAASVLHFGEEPPLVGKGGAGAVFFSGCSMKCVYCQNFGFSQLNNGKELNDIELGELFLKIQEQGGETLDLVTPTPHLPSIIRALKYAAERGFKLPLIYNTSGYEKVEILKMLEGIVDVYLADIRYTSDSIGMKYSKIPDYWTVTKRAIKEMYRQVGPFRYIDGVKRGLIVRHLVLPENLSGTEEMFEFLTFEVSLSVPISLMSQYRPVYKAMEYPEIARRISVQEYEKALELMEHYGFDGWMQHFNDDEVYRVKPLRRKI